MFRGVGGEDILCACIVVHRPQLTELRVHINTMMILHQLCDNITTITVTLSREP